MTKETFSKFLNKQLTDSELEAFVRWVNSDVFEEESKELMQEDWKQWDESGNIGDDEKFSLLFDKIYQKINFGKKEDLPTKKKSNLRVLFKWAKTAAAILFIPTFIYLIYSVSDIRSGSTPITGNVIDSLEIEASSGSRTIVQMTDGSKVHLNYGSKIKYPPIFSDESREVELFGEGYFDVAHNPEKPFIVKNGHLNIMAVGTSFNVLAYPDEEVIQITLVEGNVRLNEENGNNSATKKMMPGDHVIYNSITGDFRSENGNIEKYIAWKDGKIVFDNETTPQVATRLSRVFNVDFEIAEEVKGFTYTVTFIDETLLQILDLMSIATPVSYKVLPREKLQGGAYSKQKIKIVSRK